MRTLLALFFCAIAMFLLIFILTLMSPIVENLRGLN